MKLLKKDTKPFLNVLHKLTDNRFSFNVVSYCQHDCYYNVNLNGATL